MGRLLPSLVLIKRTAQVCPSTLSKDKTLYRSYIITDGAKHVNKNYCLNNKGEVLAEQACWRYFN